MESREEKEQHGKTEKKQREIEVLVQNRQEEIHVSF
jgi:hypothetical protein